MIISALLLLFDNTSSSPTPSNTSQQQLARRPVPWFTTLFQLLLTGRPMLVLVVVYNIANLCSLYATGTVGASISTLFAQLKILTTALCGRLILGRSYSRRKWICLLVLILGVTCVSYPVISQVVEQNTKDVDDQVALHQKMLGMLCLLLQISISGFASVYFELVLKDRHDVVTIWERNFQLAFYSVLFTLLMIAAKNGYSSYSYSSAGESSETSEGGLSYSYLLSQLAGGASRRTDLFAGWTRLAVGTALCQGCAGLFVAATLKYADAILKCFASSLAIIVVTMVNSGLFGQSIDTIVKLGVVLAIGAMLTYSLDTDVIVIHNSKHKKNN